MNNKISVIIPVYNNESYLDKLIYSIENQTYKNFEIIFIDDGSQDNSLNKLMEFSKKYDNIFVYSQKNSGPGIARMNGFIKSTGSLLYFIDSDDFLPNDKIFEKINDIFVEFNPDVIFFNREEIFDNKKEIIKFFDEYNISEGIHNINDIPKMELHGGLGCKILKSEILKKEMFIKSSNYEDFYTTYNYLDKCNNYYYCDQIFYSINHLGDNKSLTTKLNLNSLISCMDIIIKLYENINNTKLKESLLEVCPGIIIFYNTYLFKNLKKNIDQNVKDKIKIIKNMIKDNKVVYNPKNNKIIKKIIFKIFMFF